MSLNEIIRFLNVSVIVFLVYIKCYMGIENPLNYTHHGFYLQVIGKR